MKSGNFYYIKDTYYSKFGNHGVMKGKEEDENGKHGRPCFYCFEYNSFYWMIPISSQVDKYKLLYEEKIKRYPIYDGIKFGYVNGKKRAFLLQNICPITKNYIDSEYRIDKDSIPVKVNQNFAKQLNSAARKIIRLYNSGTKIVLTDLDYIIDELNSEIV